MLMVLTMKDGDFYGRAVSFREGMIEFNCMLTLDVKRINILAIGTADF